MLASLLFIVFLLLLYGIVLRNVLHFSCHPLWISYVSFVLVIEALLQVFGKPISTNINQKATAQEDYTAWRRSSSRRPHTYQCKDRWRVRFTLSVASDKRQSGAKSDVLGLLYSTS